MKQIYLLICVCFTFIVKAQVFEHSFYPDQFNSATVVESSNSGGWYIAGRTGKSKDWVTQDYIIKLDSQGNILWRKTAIGGPVLLPHMVKVLNNDDIIVTGYGATCDAGAAGFSTKISSSGTLLWYNFYTDFGYLDNSILEKINNQLVCIGIGTPSSLKYYDKVTGTFISEKLTGVYLDLHQINDNYAVATSPQNNLILLDSNEDSLSAVSFSSSIKDLKVSNNLISIVQNEHLFIFDSLLNPIDTQSFVGLFEELVDYEYRANGYHLLGKNQADYYLNYYSNTGILVSSELVGNKMKVPNAICRNGNNLLMIGHENGFSLSNTNNQNIDFQNIFVEAYDINTPKLTEVNDVEIINITVDDLNKQAATCITNQSSTQNVTWSNIAVTLRNNGTVPLNSVELAIGKRAGCIPFCNPGYANFKKDSISALNLLPGDTIVVNLADFTAFSQPDYNDYNLCVWAVVPNGKVEDDLSNNQYCINTIATNSKEIINNQNLSIFPNPTNDLLNLNFEEAINIEGIKVSNNLGQVVQNQVINEQMLNYQMNVSTLPNGIFIIEVQTDEGRIIKQFIKN